MANISLKLCCVLGAALWGGSFAFAAPPIEQGRPTLINQPGGGAGNSVTEQQLEQRLNQLTDRFVSQEGVGQLLERLTRMENEVRSLRGEVEELTDRLRRAETDARERYIDLDSRIGGGQSSINGGGNASPPSVGAPSASSSDAGSEQAQRSYRRARDLLAERQYDESVSAFQAFVSDYPDSDLADDAYFWMGEVYTLLREYDDAQAAYNRVLDDFPNSDKRADALFKLGFVAERLGDVDQALDYYGQVIDQAPDSSLANLAGQRVSTLQ